MIVILLLFGIGLYFLPTIVAFSRHAPSPGSVAVINVFLGWTFIGWVFALIMAARSPNVGAQINIVNQVAGQQYVHPTPNQWAPQQQNTAGYPAVGPSPWPNQEQSPVLEATSSASGQWASDPSGKHELRYHDGQSWTGHVSSGGKGALDPLTD